MAVPQNLTEALALLTSPSSADKITAQDLRDVVTWLALLISSPGIRIIPPSGDSSGQADRVAINAALAASLDPWFVPNATYYLDQAISVPSGRKLYCEGEAVVRPVYASGLQPTDRLNAVFKCVGTITGTVDTTLGADLFAGSTSFTTAVSIGSGYAGGWVQIRGQNPQLDFSGDSSNNFIDEIAQISPSHPGGTTSDTVHPIRIHHDVTHTVKSINPVIDVLIEGLFIDATGNNSIACGVLAQNSARITLRRVSGRNLSRAVFISYGSQEIRTEFLTDRGTCNGAALLETSHGGNLINTYRTGEGSRTHPLGYPQHEITMRAHCVGIMVDGGYIENAVGGIRMWGGIGNYVSNMTFVNLWIKEAVERDPEADPLFGQSGFGVLYDGGPPRVGGDPERSAEFSFGCGIANLRGFNIRARNKFGVAGGTQPAIYFHDQFQFSLSNVSVNNIGVDPTDAGPPCSGMVMSDCSGTIDGLILRGVDLGIMTQNVRENVMIDNVEMSGGAGNATDSTGGPAFYFDHDGGKFCSPRFGKIQMSNFGGNGVTEPFVFARFGSAWNTNPDHDLTFDSLTIDGMTYRNVRPVTCPAFSFGPTPPNGGPYPGQIGTIKASGSQPPDVEVATGPDVKNVVFVCTPHNGWTLVAHGDADIYAAAGTKVGDIYVAGSDGFPVRVTEPPPSPQRYWVVTGQYYSAYGKALAEPRTGGAPLVTFNDISAAAQTLVAERVNVLSGSATTATLPAASTNTGKTVMVKKNNLSGDVTVSRAGSDTIDGATTYTISGSYGHATFISNGTTWFAFPAA